MRTAEERRKRVRNEDRSQWESWKGCPRDSGRNPVALTYLFSIPRFQQMLVIYQVLLNSRDLKERDW